MSKQTFNARFTHEGLVYPDKRSKDKLEAVAGFFGIEVEELWNSDLNIQKLPRDNWVLIPWMGSKRKQGGPILDHFPKTIATYCEPFLGGGSMFKALLESDIKVERYRLSDRCRPLIGIWNLVKDDPRQLTERYEELWTRFQDKGAPFYKSIRSEFNESKDPCLCKRPVNPYLTPLVA